MSDQVEQKRIGILGGTFDPVHNAHLMIARQARAAAGLTSVLLMPAGVPPHKALRPLTAPEHRLMMARLAVEGMEGFGVSDLEIATPGVDYTVDTLAMLHEAWPGARLYFIIGGDSLLYLDQWHDPSGLLARAAFVAVYRPGSTLAELERKRRDILAHYAGEILLVPCEGMDVSSTEIRRRAAAGEDYSGMVPQAVERYITQHGLYREGV